MYEDFPTVSETAIEPPQDEGNSLNTPKNLSLEAMFVNRNFSQQVLKRVINELNYYSIQIKLYIFFHQKKILINFQGEEKFYFDHKKIPFVEEGESPPTDLACIGYR